MPDAKHPAWGAHLFGDLLGRAAKKVAAEYLLLPQHVPNGVGRQSAYLERVYCYELYHQMRLQMEDVTNGELTAAVATGWRVNGEVDKRSSYIGSQRTPDFIWHIPKTGVNGHILEVKRSTAEMANVMLDVEKLASFQREASYQHASLLIVGPHLRGKGQFDPVVQAAHGAGLEVLFHHAPGESLSRSQGRDNIHN